MDVLERQPILDTTFFGHLRPAFRACVNASPSVCVGPRRRCVRHAGVQRKSSIACEAASEARRGERRAAASAR
eukprot:COSAG02_NODE_17697_length_986_cov_1.479143_1_plen_72_part_10